MKKEGEMKLKRNLIAAALIATTIVFLGGNVRAYDMAEYFPLNQGDEWTYLATINRIPMPLKMVVNGTELVNEVETVKIENRMLGSFTPDYDCYVMDSEGIKLFKHHWINYREKIVVMDQGLPIYPAQFSLGEVHQQPYSVTDYDSDGNFIHTGTGTLTASIESVEDVSVPAGTFEECLNINFLVSSQRTDGSTFNRESTYWLARNVGMVKMSIADNWYTPADGEESITMASGLMKATVDGIHYGRCPAVFALQEDSNDLTTLRKFRDEVLSKTPEGRELIKLYYEWSSAIVKEMAEDELFKKEVKGMIGEIMPLVRKTVK